MNDDAALLTIGELARFCGLSISALRFYDRQGILSPVQVDAASGYRWYAPAQVEDAKLLARLRGIGLPLPEISTILARKDTAVRDAILAAHIDRLEAALAAAHEQVRLLSRADGAESSRISDTGQSVLSLSAADLAAGIRTVRHAVGDAPEWPAIHGIYLVTVNRGLRLAATDRHRAAFAEVPAQSAGRMRGLLAPADADQLLKCAEDDPSGQVELRNSRLELNDARGQRIFQAQLMEAGFPDLSHAIPVVRDSAMISVEDLTEALRADGEDGLCGLLQGSAGGLRVMPAPAAEDSAPMIQLNRAYLEDALAGLTEQGDEGGGAAERSHPMQLRFDFDGPADPVAIRRAEDLGTFAVVLPVILEPRQ